MRKKIIIFFLGIYLIAVSAGFVGCSDKDDSDNLINNDPASQQFRPIPPKLLGEFGEVICDRDFGDPKTSLFILPYLPGKRIDLIQGYCHDGGSHDHRFAIDFAIPFGDTIIASRTGVVRRIREDFDDFDYTYGHHNYVLIRHRDNSIGFYAHIAESSVVLNVGDTVHQGQMVALNGTSGMPYYYPCLHFEVFYDSLSFDRTNSAPINFRNADGLLNPYNGLMIAGPGYLATEFTTNDY